MDTKSNEFYNRKIDAELKKKELEEKYGAHFSENIEISPELENKWLNSIEEFEIQFENADKITVFEFLGKTAFKKINELKPEEIPFELDRLNGILHEGNISLSTLCSVDEKELYRFISEELFQYEMDNIRMPGMMSCFIYEEFHPNAEYDIRQAFDYFFQCTMAKMKNIGGHGYDMLYVDSENYMDSKGVSIAKNKVENAINNFLASFDSFKIISNEINNIEINDNETNATINFNIDYKGLFNNSKETFNFNGNACFKLKPSEYGGWSIYHIDLPGLRI
jgi:hypothetical protein